MTRLAGWSVLHEAAPSPSAPDGGNGSVRETAGSLMCTFPRPALIDAPVTHLEVRDARRSAGSASITVPDRALHTISNY
ncbi:hypothetical protein GCM10009857_34490 [Agromyces soli]